MLMDSLSRIHDDYGSISLIWKHAVVRPSEGRALGRGAHGIPHGFWLTAACTARRSDNNVAPEISEILSKRHPQVLEGLFREKPVPGSMYV